MTTAVEWITNVVQTMSKLQVCTGVFKVQPSVFSGLVYEALIYDGFSDTDAKNLANGAQVGQEEGELEGQGKSELQNVEGSKHNVVTHRANEQPGDTSPQVAVGRVEVDADVHARGPDNDVRREKRTCEQGGTVCGTETQNTNLQEDSASQPLQSVSPETEVSGLLRGLEKPDEELGGGDSTPSNEAQSAANNNLAASMSSSTRPTTDTTVPNAESDNAKEKRRCNVHSEP